VRDLQAHRPTHRVADQDDRPDIERLEYVEDHPGQRRDPQDMTPAGALSIARQVGDEGRRAVGERPGGRQQVAAGDREAVHVHDGGRPGDLGSLAEEDRTPLNLDPELLPALFCHSSIVTGKTYVHPTRYG
jgi:hypothetical protein